MPATTLIAGSGADVSATGQWGLAVENLKALLSESTTFQTACGVGDADGAKARIHVANYVGEGSYSRPFAVITRSDESSSSSGVGAYGFGGILKVWFERAIPGAYDDEGQEGNAEQEFYNILDGIIDDCQALSGTAGYILTRTWSVGELYRIDKDEVYGIMIDVAWGLGD